MREPAGHKGLQEYAGSDTFRNREKRKNKKKKPEKNMIRRGSRDVNAAAPVCDSAFLRQS
jgi:hypothetical protein